MLEKRYQTTNQDRAVKETRLSDQVESSITQHAMCAIILIDVTNHGKNSAQSWDTGAKPSFGKELSAIRAEPREANEESQRCQYIGSPKVAVLNIVHWTFVINSVHLQNISSYM